MATSNYPVNQLVASLLPHETLQARRDQRIDLIGPHMRGVEAEVGREGAKGLRAQSLLLQLPRKAHGFGEDVLEDRIFGGLGQDVGPTDQGEDQPGTCGLEKQTAIEMVHGGASFGVGMVGTALCRRTARRVRAHEG